jgi:hypothetical protein
VRGATNFAFCTTSGSGGLTTSAVCWPLRLDWTIVSCDMDNSPYLNCTLNSAGELSQSSLTQWVYAALSGKTLDSLWSEHTYELLIGDRPVNLAAFGSIDVAHPRVGTMRHWNVVLEAAKPGEITIHDRGKVDGEAFESTMIFTFSPP